MTRLDVLTVAGARPNFMKIAPLSWALSKLDGVRHRIVHTGQHYDPNMSGRFFEDLRIPEPWRNLNVGSGSHGRQTADVMARFEPLLEEDRPDVVVVVGDVNSTIACALVASKMGIKVAHVEAGLRSFDRSMPEEVNRILTDAISDVLYVTEASGVANLAREGVDPAKVVLAGNVMIDTLVEFRERARDSDITERLGVARKSYVTVTLHRPSNVDDPTKVVALVEMIRDVARRSPVVFPVHPRTRARIAAAGLDLAAVPGLHVCDPLGYVDFLALMDRSRLLMTDSGGVQEEACLLGVPCLTLRDNTERPVTCDVGVNRLVGSDPKAGLAAALEILERGPGAMSVPPLWDGRSATRIVGDLVARFGRPDSVS